ncbi:substrate-binding domain-containing protein [Wolbachia endosymbiont of Pentidionis agamae]|uniref:substrate-binding domain-containing protein n=1 Tax=Wolbachia endosymbiont of Pentidionis agamae TaxID=3110435 RepID=UPI002FD73AFA
MYNFISALLMIFIAFAEVEARDYIRVVGSSTVFPFVIFIAEEFSRVLSFKTPVVESIGSGAGFKIFCSGIKEDTPDIAMSSRKIKKAEQELCKRNGVNKIIELIIGYDGIVIANSNESSRFDFTKKDLFYTLSAFSYFKKNEFTKNNTEFWSDVNPLLPNIKIELYGPYKNTGTYETILTFIMLDPHLCFNPKFFYKENEKIEDRRDICSKIRDDGKYIEVGVNENIILQKLSSNKNALGIFGFSFLMRNRDKVQGSTIAGIEPNYENISSGKYILSRPLYLYIKEEHINIIEGLKEFIEEIKYSMSDKNGYLSKIGLVPLSAEKRKEVLAVINKHMM